MKKLWVLLVSCLVLSVAPPTLAQRSTATLRGTVTDQSLGVIPGATVAVRNEDTGLTRSTVTNESGIYAASDLPVGRYRVDAELSGFKTASRTGILLRVADDYVVDFVLEPGELTEVLTVQASPAPVKLLGGDVSGVVTGEQVRELPLNGRNFLQLATLMPGVSAPDGLNVKDKGVMSGVDLSVSGSDVTENLWTVDGVNNNDVGSNRTILVYPSLEAIEEFKILRNSYGPEFGGAGGAQITVVTRGGTNQFRGSAFYSGRNDALDAKNYFLEQADQPKDELRRHDFGASIGGPILKDKLHFFGSVEWNKEDRGITRLAFVPTQAERNGDFSGPRIAGCSPPIPIDPITGGPFGGNRIPADRISPGGLALLSLYSLPNTIPPADSCNNWVTSVTSPIDWAEYNVRADWTLSNASRLMVRYTQDNWKNNAPNAVFGDDPFPVVDSNWNQPSRSFVASLTQTFGASATNTLQFSYSGNEIEITRGGENPDLGSQITSLIEPIYGLDHKQYGDRTAYPAVGGNAGYSGLGTTAPWKNNMDLLVIKDDYTQVFGKHLVKAGVLVSVNRKNEDTIGGSAQNAFFWGSAGFNGWGATTGNIVADFLLRDMTWGFVEPSASRSSPGRWRDLELYAADSWQVSTRLTVDYGIRYSMFFNPYTADDRITSFQPDLFDPALGTDPCNGLIQPPDRNWCQEAGFRGGTAGPDRSLMRQDVNNVAPRAGVAYNVFGDGKTAIRAGIGQFFQRERLNPLLTLAGNPPFVSTIMGIRKLDTTAEPCNGCFGTTFGTASAGRELDFVTPNHWQWNVTFQHEVWRNNTIEVGYVGNYGYDLLRAHDANQVLSGDRDHDGVDDRLQYARTVPSNAALHPFVATDFPITFWDHGGRSTYHSLQTQYISRFGRGSQAQASYTLARSRSNYQTSSSGTASGSGADLQNADVDWGRPDMARTHIFNASLIWLLPALDQRSALVRGVLGNWEIAAVVGAASGQPVTASAFVPELNGGPSGTGFGSPQFPIRTDAPCRAESGRKEQIINPAAYSLNGFRLGTIGSARRGDCTGPDYFQTDMAFYKNVQVAGRVRLQLRWEIFNLFNNVNFLSGSVNTNLAPSSMTLDAPRDSATTIVNATLPGNFGQASATRDARQMQFGVKLLW